MAFRIILSGRFLDNHSVIILLFMCFTIGSKLKISLELCKEVLHYQVFAWQIILHLTTAIKHPKMHRDKKCINSFNILYKLSALNFSSFVQK